MAQGLRPVTHVGDPDAILGFWLLSISDLAGKGTGNEPVGGRLSILSLYPIIWAFN